MFGKENRITERRNVQSLAVACSEFLPRTSEEKAGKIEYFIQKRDNQIASDRGCQYDFLKIPETLRKNPRKPMTYFS